MRLTTSAILFLGAICYLSAGSAAQQPAADIPLDSSDWRMGSFEIGDGIAKGAALETFDDSSFRRVTVPGDTQIQAGFTGIERFRESKELLAVNQKEWWYRKHFHVGSLQEGTVSRIVFDGSDYFTTVWLNGKLLGSSDANDWWTGENFHIRDVKLHAGENHLLLKLVRKSQEALFSPVFTIGGTCTKHISDLGSILSAPFAALAASPGQAGSAIGSGLSSGLGAIGSAITNGLSGISSASNIFSFLWSWLLSIVSAVIGLPFVILGLTPPISFGVTVNAPALTPSNTAPTSAFTSSLLTDWTLSPVGGSSTSYSPAVTTPDPTVAPVPQSGANTISNGSSATTSGNFSVMLPGGAGSGPGGTGYQ